MAKKLHIDQPCHICNHICMYVDVNMKLAMRNLGRVQEIVKKTCNTWHSLVVTDPTTTQALTGLAIGERTGPGVFSWLWSHVLIELNLIIIKHYVPAPSVSAWIAYKYNLELVHDSLHLNIQAGD